MVRKIKTIADLERLDKAFAKKRAKEQRAFIKKRNMLIRKAVKA